MRRLGLAVAPLLAACVGGGPAMREALVLPQATEAMRDTRRLAVLVDVTARTAVGGVPHDSPEAAAELRARALAIAQEALAGRGVELVPAADPGGEARQVGLLFRKVSRAAMAGPVLPGSERPTSYGLGELGPLLDPVQADHLLLAWTQLDDEDLLGFGARQDGLVTLGLVDRSGHLLWLRGRTLSSQDARAGAREAGETLKRLLAALPGAR